MQATPEGDTEYPMADMPRVGDPAPDFTLPSQDGTPVTLSDLTREGTVVLFFYPKDETPICTKEACAFRDSHEVFKDAGARVVGVSADSVSSHGSFARNHRLPYLLLSDEKREVQAKYGVAPMFGIGIFTGRVTFVIDKKGVVRHAHSARFESQGHVDEAMAVVKQLQV
jgi:thioredoxin-dependent peroxiredoxin